MQARMKNPAVIIPEAMKSLLDLSKTVRKAGVPQTTIELVQLRVSQINGCSVCVDGDARSAGKAGVSDEQRFAVAAWRDTPYFTDAERAALALAEVATRLADRPEPVPDAIWDEAAKHFSEQELAGLTLAIGITNLFNRLNVTTRQIAGPQPWE
ncbi:carboxymuconolactone decarboxylase family protein [Streptomyces piniterrae]|uniref:Carboxymuconolactone decarboxylase family protein n=1 Tax=Streptomyces piniterrae TaxID=2571125 RepID=A0A4U0N8S4_9ACTN|nr:carboxymuconolactone decarboxylase family protein [Streptomyces piniterrae]TJZ50215.1 carboxymuconolactone decarboxylase family protein [Streptomyces piniterrae]